MNVKFFSDLLPILIFFAVYKFQDIYAATVAAMLATTVQIAWSKFKYGKVDTILWISFAVVGVFGSATLFFHNETFIKVKPSVLYWLFSSILLVSHLLFHKNLIYRLLHEKIALPTPVWNRLNLMWSAFFFVLGVVNLYIAFNFSTDTWVNFKLFGFSAMMFIFVIAQGFWLMRYLDEDKEHN